MQGNAAQGNSAQGSTVSFFNDVQAHDALIVGVQLITSDSTLTLTGITDSLKNQYQVVGGGAVYVPDAILYVALAMDTDAGPDTITVTASSQTDFDGFELYAHEFSGLATSNAFNATSWSTGTSTAKDGMQSGLATTTSSNELLFGFGVSDGSAEAGSNFQLLSNFFDNVTESRVVGAPGSYEATATMTSGTEWGMIVDTFRGQ